MGDLANMTSVHGEVDGFRLLRWLRSRAAMADVEFGESSRRGNRYRCGWHAGREDLLTEMADDLERELTPPDYPDDDGREPERRCPNCRGTGFMDGTGPDIGRNQIACQECDGTGRDFTAGDDGVGLDDKDTGLCEACGRLADRVPVRDNGRVFFACPGCAARASGDTVNLDDTALTDGP